MTRVQLGRDAKRYVALAGATPGFPESLKRDIALALAHLADESRLHRDLLASLDRDECYVRTELERLQQRSPQYSLDEARIHARLLAIEGERRRLAVQHAERVRALQVHLAACLAKVAPLLDDD